MHGFNNLIAQLNGYWLQILRLPVDILLLNFALKGPGVERELDLSGGIVVHEFLYTLHLLLHLLCILFLWLLLLFVRLLHAVLIICTVKEGRFLLYNWFLCRNIGLLILHERLLSAHDSN